MYVAVHRDSNRAANGAMMTDVTMRKPIRRDILKDWEVLVVEDDPDSMDVATLILQFYGAKVYSAHNGQEALTMLATLRPRFIISDLSMPVMSGWDLIDRLKRDRRLMDIPAIALTAHAMVGDREKAIAAGFYNYLTKPLTAMTFMHDLLALLIDIPTLSAALTQQAEP